jgi:Dolichyl-phosphate-mannose-protein mannosyltransferase
VKLLPRVFPSEDEEDQRLDLAAPSIESEAEPSPHRLHWGWTAAIAVGAAIPRLLYVFVFTDPENPGDGKYDDVWHHWQIAYLTKQIGLSAPDGPRLWDLKGLDYFWGILHPLLMVAVFDVTGSIDIVLNRLVSVSFGVLAVVLLFHITRHYWGIEAAVASALFAALLPTSVMNDASGMLEPLGTALILLGIWAWTRRSGSWAGLSLGLATMVRAEAWIFGIGMVIAAALAGRRQRGPLILGFVSVVVLYMLVLFYKTGNPIYPLWWNFLANALGKWEVPVTAYQAGVRPVLAGTMVFALVGLGLSLWRRPPGYLLLTFGFGSWVFVSGLMGFTSYLADWAWWTPIGRHFEFPWTFVALLLVIGLLGLAPRRFGKLVNPFAWTTVAAVLLVSQLAWIPINDAFAPTESTWLATLADSRELGTWYNQLPYQGHAMAVPPDRPDITYGLARFGSVDGKHLVSEMYDPFAYLPSSYMYAQHVDVVNTLLECWINSADIRLIAIPPNNQNYQLMLQSNPGWFEYVGTMANAGWMVEAVSTPRPSATECRAAQSASQ